ncbi:hypothetical protein ACIPYV_18930 [Paenarthrobacter nicotinovorans]|uniref:hypothetical protein n=1 Tax=Paenarthrobacter nicotinovorans TaxID=29320 RepID=UPI00381F1FAC
METARRRKTVSSRLQALAGTAFAAMFKAIKVVRPHRPIHPKGIRLVGTLDRDKGTRQFSGIPWLDASGSTQVDARISRSIGPPDAFPDIIGLAVRFTEGKRSDMLLATTGPTGLGRFILRLRRDAAGAVFSSMMPYKSNKGPVLIAARTIGGPEKLPMDPGAFRSLLSETAWTLELHHASPLGSWTRFGTLTLRVADHAEDTHERFGPVLNPLPTAGTYGWTRRLREPSYATARRRK